MYSSVLSDQGLLVPLKVMPPLYFQLNYNKEHNNTNRANYQLQNTHCPLYSHPLSP